MVFGGRVHDRAILDALEAIDPIVFDDLVWRVTQAGRQPLRGSSANGRWSPAGEFEVLYTSLEQHGALAEIGFRLSLEPIWPSKLEHEVHTIKARTERTLHFVDLDSLRPFGVKIEAYERFDYKETQAIASAAHFMEFDGLLVPSARATCKNLVVFLDRLTVGAHLEVLKTESVNWEEWRRARN